MQKAQAARQQMTSSIYNTIADFLKSPFSKTIGILFGIQAMAMLFALVHSTFNRFTYEKYMHGTNNNEQQLKNNCNAAQPVEFDIIQATAHAAAYKLGLYDIAGRVGSKFGEAMGRNFTQALTWRAQVAVGSKPKLRDSDNETDNDEVGETLDIDRSNTSTRNVRVNSQ